MGYMGEIGNNADNNIRAIYLDIVNYESPPSFKTIKEWQCFFALSDIRSFYTCGWNGKYVLMKKNVILIRMNSLRKKHVKFNIWIIT